MHKTQPPKHIGNRNTEPKPQTRLVDKGLVGLEFWHMTSKLLQQHIYVTLRISKVCLTGCGLVLDVCNCMQGSNGPASIADGLLHEVHIRVGFVLLCLQILILYST